MNGTAKPTVKLTPGRELRLGPGLADDELVGGLAVDDRHVYATFFHSDAANPHRPGPGELVVIDQASFQAVARIQVGNEPRRVALAPAAQRAVVVNRGTESFGLSIVDTGAQTELSQVGLRQGPVDVAVHERSGRVYVTNVFQRKVHVVDMTSGALVNEIVVGPSPVGINVDQRTHLVSVAMSFQSPPAGSPRTNEVVVIDGETAAVMDRIALGDGPIQPSTAFLDPVTGLVHVGTLGGGGVAPTVTVVNRDGPGFVDSVIRTAAGVANVAADGQAGLLYVAAGGSVQAIDIEDGQVVATLRVGRSLEGLAVNPANGHVYAGDRLTGTVYEIVPTIARDEDPRAQATAPIAAVARAGNSLDLFVTGDDGELRTARWTEDAPADDWTGWQSMLAGLPPGAPVGACRSGPDEIRVATVNADRNVMVRTLGGETSTFWRSLVSDVPPGAHVAMTTRGDGIWRLFTVGTDGVVFSAGEELGGGIQTTVFGGMTFPAGAPIAVVANDPDEWNLFVIDADGAVWTLSWTSGSAPAPWRSLGGTFAPATRLTAVVSRHVLFDVFNPDRAGIDVFAVGPDGELLVSSRDADGDWSEWGSLGSPPGGLVPGSAVGVVSRTQDQLDMAVVGGDGRAWTRSRSFAANWSDWVPLGVRAAAPGAEVTLVNPTSDRLDVFWATRAGSLNTAWWHGLHGKWSSLQGIVRHIPTPRRRFREPIVSDASLSGHLIVDIWEDGSYVTQGHIHNGHFDPFDYVQQGTLLGGDGVPAIASHQRGHLDGTLSEGPFGSPERNDDWADLGWNLMVFDRWDDLQAGRLDMQIAYENVGLGGFLDDIGATLLGLVVDPLTAVQRLAPLLTFGNGAGAVFEALARKFGVADGLLLDVAVAFVVGPSALIPVALEVAGVVRDRDLSPAERALAQRVFGDTLPLDRIRVTSLKGLGGHPFVMPTNGPTILMNMGPEAFDDLASDVDAADGKPGQTFVHELVHVWQIANDPFFTGWVTSGILTQASKIFGDEPYEYGYPDSSGRGWGRFGIEQQAELVEEWYQRHWPALDGLAAITDPYFRFVRDHIRLGRR